MGIFCQPIGIGPEFLTLMDQTESMGYHRIAGTGRWIDFKFNDFLSRFRNDLYHLAVYKAQPVRILGMQDKGARPFPFVPLRITHMGVGIVVEMAARGQNEGITVFIFIEGLSLQNRVDFF